MTMSVENTPLDRHANALANIQQMIDDLRDERAKNAELNADIKQWMDRTALMVEERDYFRKQTAKYQKRSVELATVVANIGLLSVKAQEMILNIEEEDKNDEHTDTGKWRGGNGGDSAALPGRGGSTTST